jgi:iron complex outermembrane receptor protein
MNPALDPQHGRTLELGLEARPGPRLQLEAMGFWTRLEDQLIPFEVPSAPGRSFFRNAGSSRIHGLELSAFVLLSDGLRIRGAYTFTDARFREFELQGVSMGGNRLPGVTRHRLEAVPRWDVSSREGRPGGFLELRLLYNGDLPVDDANSDFAAPFALVDLRGEVQSWRLGKRELSFLGGVTNLLDRSYSTAVSVNAFGGRYFEPGPGRSFYLGIRAGLSP